MAMVPGSVLREAAAAVARLADPRKVLPFRCVILNGLGTKMVDIRLYSLPDALGRDHVSICLGEPRRVKLSGYDCEC
jgi:hypothetical protein